MPRHPLIAAAIATLAGCGPGPALESDRFSLVDDADQEAAEEAAPDPKQEQALNGTDLEVGGPVLNGCELKSGMPVPQGCSNNGPFLGSTLAWVSLGSITAVDGSAVESATLQGNRLVGVVNGVQVDAAQLKGAQFNGTTTDGRAVRLRLDGARAGTRERADVWRYEFSYRNAKGSWKDLCRSNKKAVIVSGRWDYNQGQPGDGAKIHDSTVFTVACRRSAVEKCLNGGYKPWVTAGGVSLDAHHQACVRMMRADYCGDGVSHTVGGTRINVFDPLGIEVDSEDWVKEGEWTAAGARCLSAFNYYLPDAPCVPALVTKSCGEASSYGGSDTLLISETPRSYGRLGDHHEDDD